MLTVGLTMFEGPKVPTPRLACMMACCNAPPGCGCCICEKFCPLMGVSSIEGVRSKPEGVDYPHSWECPASDRPALDCYRDCPKSVPEQHSRLEARAAHYPSLAASASDRLSGCWVSYSERQSC